MKGGDSGGTALHLAGWFARTLTVLEAVLQADPQAAESRDPFGQLPFFFAVQHNKSDERVAIVQRLLLAYPAALQARNMAGRTPLQYLNVAADAHVAVLLTLLIIVGLVKPLTGAMGRGDNAAVGRVAVMLVLGLNAMVAFVRSFIAARKARG